MVNTALEYAGGRACDRCDKYNDVALTESQRATLIREFGESFWLALGDAGVELK